MADQDTDQGAGEGGEETGIDVETDPNAGGEGDGGDSGGGEGEGGAAAAAGDSSADGGGETRRDRNRKRGENARKWQEDRQRWEEDRRQWQESQRAMVEELRALRQETRAARSGGEEARESPREAEMKALNTKIAKHLQRLKHLPAEAQEDALAEYHDMVAEREILAGEIGAERYHRTQQRDNPPRRPPTPEFRTFARDFPFVDPDSSDFDPHLRGMVNDKAGRIARLKNRDMNNPRVRWATLREAAAAIAQAEGIDVPGNGGGGRAPAGHGRVAGNGGRTGAGGDGASLNGYDMEKVDQAAEAMYPEISDPRERRQKWLDGPGKRYASAK